MARLVKARQGTQVCLMMSVVRAPTVVMKTGSRIHAIAIAAYTRRFLALTFNINNNNNDADNNNNSNNS